jgi:hypothetical protein
MISSNPYFGISLSMSLSSNNSALALRALGKHLRIKEDKTMNGCTSLVTGVGFIGSHLNMRLLKEGHARSCVGDFVAS